MAPEELSSKGEPEAPKPAVDTAGERADVSADVAADVAASDAGDTAALVIDEEATREAREKLESEYYKKFKLGRYKVKKEEVKGKPFDKKEGDIKLYELHAESDMTSHKEINNGPKWYADKLAAAKAMVDLTKVVPDVVRFEGFDWNKLKPLIESLADGSNDFSHEGLKKMVKNGVSKTDIYAGTGVLNLLLAFQRAVAPLLAKGIKYEKLSDYFIMPGLLAQDPANGKWKIEGEEVKGTVYTNITLRLDRKMVKVNAGRISVSKPVSEAPVAAPAPAPVPAPAPAPAPVPVPAPAPAPAPRTEGLFPLAPAPAAKPAPTPAEEAAAKAKETADRAKLQEMQTALAKEGISMVTMPENKFGTGYAKIEDRRAFVTFNEDGTFDFELACTQPNRGIISEKKVNAAKIKEVALSEPVVKEAVRANDLQHATVNRAMPDGTNEKIVVTNVIKNPDNTYSLYINVIAYWKTIPVEAVIDLKDAFKGEIVGDTVRIKADTSETFVMMLVNRAAEKRAKAEPAKRTVEEREKEAKSNDAADLIDEQAAKARARREAADAAAEASRQEAIKSRK
ncbi:MAG: hypothetical protein WC285_05290 [Candidatus Gracilibacteria bacterium]|jgi:hypothetical protein